MMLSTWPMPICCSGVGVLPHSFFHIGQRQRSVRITPAAVEIKAKTIMEPAETWKWRQPPPPTWRSVDRAWSTVRLRRIPIGVLRKMLDDHKGRILIRFLRSSTCWTVQSFHGFAIEPSGRTSPSDLRAARFSDLHSSQEVTS